MQEKLTTVELKATCSECAKSLTATSTQDRCPDCGGLVFCEEQSLPAGYVIANSFEIIEQIGSGAWGVVYRARQPSLERDVAIKVLHKHLLRQRKIERFMQEVRSLQEFDHEGVAAVYDSGGLDTNQPYLVQEYVAGVSLRDLLKGNEKITTDQFKTIFGQILEILAHAHTRGIVHRDIKPSNIMVSDLQSRIAVKLLDFGIAKLINQDGTPSLTATGDTLGTPLYMSPEQCTGESLDGRADLYSVGCMMHEALSGVPPFVAGNSFECMMKQLNEAPPDLREVGITEGYSCLVMKAMSKAPDQRFQTADEFRTALEALPNDLSTESRKLPLLTRKQGLPLAIAFSLLLALSGCLYFFFGSNNPLMPLMTNPAPLPSSTPQQSTARQQPPEPADLFEEELPLKPQELSAEPHSTIASGLKFGASFTPRSAAGTVPSKESEKQLSQRSAFGTFAGNGKLLDRPIALPVSSQEAICDQSAKRCFALSDQGKFCTLDIQAGRVTEIALPDDVPAQASGIAFDASEKLVYVLSSRLLCYDIERQAWNRLGEFPNGGTGFTYLPASNSFYILGRSTSTPGHIRNLFQFNAGGNLLKKIKLSNPILTADGNGQSLQLRPAGAFIVAIVPQPKQNMAKLAQPLPLVVLIDPKNGQVLNMATLGTSAR